MAVQEHQARRTRKTDLSYAFFSLLSPSFTFSFQSSLTSKKTLFISNLHANFGFNLAIQTFSPIYTSGYRPRQILVCHFPSLQHLFWILANDTHRGKTDLRWHQIQNRNITLVLYINIKKHSNWALCSTPVLRNAFSSKLHWRIYCY